MHRTVIGTALSLLLVIPVLAQTPPQTPPVTNPPAQGEKPADKDKKPVEATATVIHEEVSVTATRYEVDTFQTTVPTTVISGEDLDRVKPEKIMDLLKETTGVDVQGEGPFRGIPVIRGLASNRVLILVDGQRLNNARESTEFAGIQPALVDLGQVERVEVVRGPSSVLYGSDAIGGVINIITRQQPFTQGSFDLSGGASAEYGDNAKAQRGRIELNGAGEHFTFHVDGSAAKADNYYSPEAEVPNSQMEQKGFNGNLRFLLGQSSVLRVEAQSTKSSDIGFPGYDPATSGIDIAFPHFDRDKYSAAYEAGPFWGLEGVSVTTYYQKVHKESKRNISVPGYFSNNYTTSDIDTWGGNAQSSASFGRHHMVFGLDAYEDTLHDETTATNPFSTNHNVAVPDSFQRGLGLYIQDSIALAPRWQIGVGARGDQFRFKSDTDPRYKGVPFDETESALSGNLSARYEATQNVALTALLGRGFRAPNLQERSFLGLSSDGTTYVEQNPNLSSETSWNYELGFKVRYPRYSGGFSVFRTDATDFIGLKIIGKYPPRPTMDLARFENYKRATIEGFELDLDTFLSAGWTVLMSTSYTRGTDETTGNPLPLIAPWKGVIGLRWEHPRWWSEASVRMLSRNTRVAPGTQESPGFAVLDLRGGFDIVRDLTVMLAVQNAGNTAYKEPFNNRLEMGRNVRAAVSYKF